MENLGIDIKLLIAQVVNFLLFFFILKKFAVGPFLKFVKSEKEKEKEKAKIDEEITKAKTSWHREELEMKAALKKESDRLLKIAKEEAGKIKLEIINDAKREIESMNVKAKLEIEEAKKQLEKDMESKIMDVAVAIVERSLKNYLTESARQELTQQILKNLERA